ncbi:extracellular calcium-sensing receptor-like isoform X2 [Hydractinia symbiolongicarpus]|nr:extracellular calcium-sensing receptor-like isoform X2 [Hydractinia symbiolongicarpus]
MIDAIEQHNLRNRTQIGYMIYDTCSNHNNLMKIILDLTLDKSYFPTNNDLNSSCNTCETLSNVPIMAVFGRMSRDLASRVNNLLRPNNIPFFCYTGDETSSSLDSNDYANFRQIKTATKDGVVLISDVIKQKNWTYVGIITTNDVFGTNARKILWSQLKNITCLVTKTFRVNNITSIRNVIRLLQKDEELKIIILWVSRADAQNFLTEVERMKLYHRTWIANTAWSTMTVFLSKLNTNVTQGIVQSSGTLRITEYHARLMEYFSLRTHNTSNTNQWLKTYFEKNSIYSNTSTQLWELREHFNIDESKYASSAINNALLSIEHIMKYAGHLYSSKNYRLSIRIIKYTRTSLVQRFKNLKDKYPFISILFDPKGRKPSTMLYWPLFNEHIDVLPWAGGGGRYTNPPVSTCQKPKCQPSYQSSWGVWKDFHDTNWDCRLGWKCTKCPYDLVSFHGNACVKCPKQAVPNKQQTECNFYKIKYQHNNFESYVVYAVAGIGVSLTLFITTVFVYNRGTPLIKSSNMNMSIMQLLTHVLLFLLALLWIGMPTYWKCILGPGLTGFLYTINLSITLVKTQRFSRIFKSRTLFSRRQIQRSFVNDCFVASLLVVIQFAVFSLSTVIQPVRVLLTKEPSTLTEHLRCNTTSHLYVQLLYLLVLSMLIMINSYKARKLPENFNETKFICYGVFVFMVTIMALVPIQLGRKFGERFVIVDTLLISLPNFALLVFMYTLKVYIVLFKPEKNTVTVMRSQLLQKMSEKVQRSIDNSTTQK